MIVQITGTRIGNTLVTIASFFASLSRSRVAILYKYWGRANFFQNNRSPHFRDARAEFRYSRHGKSKECADWMHTSALSNQRV